MLNFLDVKTAYFIAGLMYFVMPLLVWGGLHKEKSKSIPLWCIGGEVFGVGLVLMSMRPYVQPWISHELASTLICIGALARIRALHEIRGLKKNIRPLLILGAVHSVGYIFLRQLRPDIPAYFVWAVYLIGIEYAWTSWLAYSIGQDQKLTNLRWMTLAYSPLALVLFYKGTSTLIALAGMEPIQTDSISANSANLLIAFLGTFGAVLSNTSFLAMFVERSAHERQANIELNAQRKATETLAHQISVLDRQRSLHTMAAALSHELGQPMTSIQLMTDIWRQSPQTIDAQEVLSQVHSNIGTAIGILDRMRNLGKADSIALQKVDLLDIHQQVIILMHDWLRLENVHIELHNAGTTTTVQGDPVQLSQILINLYRNAVQASSNQSSHKLQIRVSNTVTHVTLCVRDNGPGFSTQALQNVERGNVYTSKKDGLGIGLSIVRDILKNHNGQLTLSNHPEGGAQVEITLPR